MALKDNWKNRQDGVDYASAEDINMIADAVINLENSQGTGSGGNGSFTIVDDKMSDVSQNPVQNQVIKQYVDSTAEELENTISTVEVRMSLVSSTATDAKEKAEEALTKIDEIEDLSIDKITLTAENEMPVLGAELATADGWNASGWTGSFATGFTHTSGNISPLSFNIPNIAVGKSYVVAFRCSKEFSDTNILVTIGDAPASPMYGIPQIDITQWGVRAIDTGALTFTPTSDFDGTISEISIREITGVSTPYMSVYDTENNVPIEQRTGKESLQNIFIGKGVGGKNISGFDNFVIGGDDTFQNNISGFWNIGIGQQTLQDNVSGSRNISIGRSNLMSNISGTRNVCIGTYVLTKAKNPNHNVVIGADAMNLATGSESNVVIGFQAMYYNTTGSHNVCIGDGAGKSVKDMTNAKGEDITGKGQKNVFIGSAAGLSNGSGSYNTGLGCETLLLNREGIHNIVLGYSAANKATSPNRNVIIGNYAFNGTKTTGSGGDENVVIGFEALRNEVRISKTIAIGVRAGSDISTASESIIIGYQCTLPSAYNANNLLNIGNLLKGSLKAGEAYLDINGGLQLGNIPTSDPNIAGRVWNDNGTLKVSTGA